MKYEIGQEVWWASFESEVDYVTCPDCGGTCIITCTLFDGTIHTIDCSGCSRGYEGPQGRLRVYKRTPRAVRVTIKGLEVREGKTEWQHTGSYRSPETDLFDVEADALRRASDIAVTADAEERDRIARKEKDTRSWAWNTHYHRSEIRRAEQSIAYHTSKLTVASAKAKEDRK